MIGIRCNGCRVSALHGFPSTRAADAGARARGWIVSPHRMALCPLCWMPLALALQVIRAAA